MYIVSVHCPMRHITHKTERDFCDGSMYICCPDIYYLSIRSLVFCVHLTKYVFNILHQQTPPFFFEQYIHSCGFELWNPQTKFLWNKWLGVTEAPLPLFSRNTYIVVVLVES